MNFYHAYYNRQFYDEDICDWIDTGYQHQGIIVIANDYNEAVSKIYKCLEKAEDNINRRMTRKYRADMVKITECIGLDVKEDFESGSNIFPISID